VGTSVAHAFCTAASRLPHFHCHIERSYQHLGDMMSLGTTSGAVTLPIPVPPPLSAVVQSNGPLSQLLRVAGVKLSGSYGGSSDGVTLEGPLAAAVS